MSQRPTTQLSLHMINGLVRDLPSPTDDPLLLPSSSSPIKHNALVCCRPRAMRTLPRLGLPQDGDDDDASSDSMDLDVPTFFDGPLPPVSLALPSLSFITMQVFGYYLSHHNPASGFHPRNPQHQSPFRYPSRLQSILAWSASVVDARGTRIRALPITDPPIWLDFYSRERKNSTSSSPPFSQKISPAARLSPLPPQMRVLRRWHASRRDDEQTPKHR
ncbi:hypothetical protein B0H14DRAFT_735034 [Mycena olivaceomarginata]|nr:hypothetical protein B0H14DRAFT_735034 [Mycena olivaceomarginata]